MRIIVVLSAAAMCFALVDATRFDTANLHVHLDQDASETADDPTESEPLAAAKVHLDQDASETADDPTESEPLAAAKERHAQMKEELARLEQHIATQAALQAEEAAKAKLAQTVQQRESHLQGLKSALDTAEEEEEQAWQNASEARRAYDEAQEQKKQAKSNVDRMAAESLTLSTLSDALQTEVESLTASLQNKLVERNETEERLAMVTKELEHSRQQLNITSQELTDAHEMVQQTSAQYVTAAESLNKTMIEHAIYNVTHQRQSQQEAWAQKAAEVRENHKLDFKDVQCLCRVKKDAAPLLIVDALLRKSGEKPSVKTQGSSKCVCDRSRSNYGKCAEYTSAASECKDQKCNECFSTCSTKLENKWVDDEGNEEQRPETVTNMCKY